MIIDNKPNIILAYFNMNKIDYVLYTIDDGIAEIYLSKVTYHPKHIDFESINKKESKNLKMIISEFLVDNHNYSFLRKVGYNRLSIDQLKANKINRNGFQLIHLTNRQYEIFASNDKLKQIKKKKNYLLLIILIILIIVLVIMYFIK